MKIFLTGRSTFSVCHKKSGRSQDQIPDTRSPDQIPYTRSQDQIPDTRSQDRIPDTRSQDQICSLGSEIWQIPRPDTKYQIPTSIFREKICENSLFLEFRHSGIGISGFVRNHLVNTVPNHLVNVPNHFWQIPTQQSRSQPSRADFADSRIPSV